VRRERQKERRKERKGDKMTGYEKGGEMEERMKSGG